MNPIQWIANKFKKEEKKDYPYEFAIVRLSESAKNSYINDDLNKVLTHYRGGRIVREIPYTEEDVKLFQEIEEIPVYEEELSDDYEFYQEPHWGEVVNLQ